MSYTAIVPGMPFSVVRDILNTANTTMWLMKAKERWNGKKWVFLTDSTGTQNTIQPEFVRLTGCVYDHAESTTGTGGHAPMAVAGSEIRGFSDTPGVGDLSIYKRAADVKYYSPDLITVIGGANDNATA